MVATPTKLPVRTEDKAPATASTKTTWRAFDDFRREIDTLFEDFAASDWLKPFKSVSRKLEPAFRRTFNLGTPAVDVVEDDTAFKLTAELPGMTAKDVDVSMKDGSLVIRGEKKAESEEKSKDYYLSERQYGSFERFFALPASVDPSAIEARFDNGILTVTLPKTAEAQKPATRIEVKAA